MDELYFDLLAKSSYVGLFGVLLLAGLGLPLPEDIPLLAAGWLVHQGKADLTLMILVGLAGVMVGDSMLFTMGRRYGDRIVEHRWLRRVAKPWLLERARRMFLTHGSKILFAARFMPGFRSVLFLTAGAFKIPFWRFFLIDGFAALISVPVWVWLGAKFSSKIEEILGGARIGGIAVGAALVVGVVIWVIYEVRLQRRGRGPATRVVSEVETEAVGPAASELGTNASEES